MKRGLPIVLLALGLAAACGGSSGHGHGSAPGLAGVVFADNGDPARGQPVVLDPATPGAPFATVGADGRFFLTPVAQGAHVLRFGDSVTTPTIYVPFTSTETTSYLERPVFLPLLSSGVQRSVPPTVGGALTVSGPELSGVTLAIQTSTVVSYPVNANQQISLVGVSPSRLPVAPPIQTGAPRAAYCVEPRGVRFSPSATLTVPVLENSPNGWDLWQLDDGGTWGLVAPLALVDSNTLAAPINEGALYAAIARTAPPVQTITGRVVSGARPVAGYRVACWNQVSAPTGADGRYTIRNVPQSFGGLVLQASPAKPGVDFAPEVAISVGTLNGSDVGDLVVNAQAPNNVRPKILSTQPFEGQKDVPLQTQLTIQFSNAVDPLVLGVSLRGLSGPVTGQTFLSNAFTAVFVPSTNLVAVEKYDIVIDPATADLSGNTVDDTHLVFHFTTVNQTPPPPPPTDQKIFGMTPIVGTAQTQVVLSGRNFPGGSAVKVGSSVAQVRLESATEIRFLPSTLEPASDATIAVINSANTTVTSFGPLVFDLRSSIASLSTESIVRSSLPTDLFVTGTNTASGTVVIDGLTVASIDSTELVGGLPAITGRQVTVSGPATPLFTGPVMVRGANGKNGLVYRFIQVADR